jgi:hypothetical protein
LVPLFRLVSKKAKIVKHRNIILPVTLYGVDVGLTLTEKQIKGVHNTVLRRIFGTRKEEVRGRRKLCNEDRY